MGTIRDQRSGQILDVDDDGRRMSFTVPAAGTEFECCISDSALCVGHDGVSGAGDVTVTFDKAELMELLNGGK